MTRGKISLAIVLVLATIGLIAIISKTDSSVRTLELNLQTKDQQLKIFEAQKESINQELEKAKGDSKKLKELEKKNQELQKAVEDAQARKAEKLRLAQAEAKNVAQASAQTVSAPTGDWVTNCHTWASQAGIVLNDSAIKLLERESHCNPLAWNASSGAGGIPQALPFTKTNCQLSIADAPCQLKWFQGYVMGRYGSYESALAHSYANSWY